jgi:SNF family Na+-dependent transporter
MSQLKRTLGLAIWASTLKGVAEGYRWYLIPDFSKINLQVVLSALGQ